MNHLVTQKTEAEVMKLKAEIRKLNTETFWHPVAISAAIITATVGLTLTILKLSGAL